MKNFLFGLLMSLSFVAVAQDCSTAQYYQGNFDGRLVIPQANNNGVAIVSYVIPPRDWIPDQIGYAVVGPYGVGGGVAATLSDKLCDFSGKQSGDTSPIRYSIIGKVQSFPQFPVGSTAYLNIMWTSGCPTCRLFIENYPPAVQQVVVEPIKPPVEVPLKSLKLVEFINKKGEYFITGYPDEITSLNKGTAWTQTGQFMIVSSYDNPDRKDYENACRWYLPTNGSHFFSSNKSECDYLASLNPQNKNPKEWILETMKAFMVIPNIGQTCPPNTYGVIRFFNRSQTNPNHRYTNELTVIDQMTKKGWVNEGIVFCSNG